jgi:hypothetical protein
MNLGRLYETTLKDYTAEKPLYEEALLGFMAKLGEDHQYTQVAKQNLQGLLDAM